MSRCIPCVEKRLRDLLTQERLHTRKLTQALLDVSGYIEDHREDILSGVNDFGDLRPALEALEKHHRRER